MELTLLQDGTETNILSLHRSDPKVEEERLSEADLVLDEVDLTRVELALVKDQAMSFLRSNGGVLAQPVVLFWIKNDGVYTSLFPTTDGNALAQSIATGHVFPTDWKFPTEAVPGVTPRDALWGNVFRTVYALAMKFRDKPG
jgi:hypothetical protein